MSRGPMEVGAGSAPECVVLVFISVLSRSTPEIVLLVWLQVMVFFLGKGRVGPMGMGVCVVPGGPS